MGFLLGGKSIDFSGDDLPMLISGKDGSGASFFSIAVVADLIRKGNKAVFFSAYPMAKDDLRKITNDREREGTIIIDSGEEDALITMLDEPGVADGRIVFVKNIENYSERLLEKISGFDRVIISGDIDKCLFAESLDGKEFMTEIFFTRPEHYHGKDFPSLQKYQGFISSSRLSGVIKISG